MSIKKRSRIGDGEKKIAKLAYIYIYIFGGGARVRYSEACGIFPGQGLNPCLLHWQADCLPLTHRGRP